MTLVLAILVGAAFAPDDLPRSGSLALVAGSAAAAASLLTLNGRVLNARSPGGAASRATASFSYGLTAGLVVLALLLVADTFDERAPMLAVAAGLMTASVGSAMSLLERLGAGPATAAAGVLALVASATAAPLWLGPASELVNSPMMINAVLAVSPLTLFAVPAEFDYLRTGWFYQHTAIGSLRYAYPSGWLLIAIYSVLPLVSLGQETLRRIVAGRAIRTSLGRAPGSETQHGI